MQEFTLLKKLVDSIEKFSIEFPSEPTPLHLASDSYIEYSEALDNAKTYIENYEPNASKD